MTTQAMQQRIPKRRRRNVFIPLIELGSGSA